MDLDRVKLQDIVASQLPSYVVDDFPLLPEFLEQYYTSQEFKSGPVDILKNIDQYVKVDQLYDLQNSTVLGEDLDYTSGTIHVSSEAGTWGFVDRDGLIKINEEIIYYESKTNNTFENCSRGFSGITTYQSPLEPDKLEFSRSLISDHKKGAKISNLNILFLQQFFKRLKGQVVPGFEERTLFPGLDERNFIFNADSFYTSKGSEESQKILFRALYGENVEVIKPSEYLIRPSNADYKVTQDYIVEKVQGNPLELMNRTLYQESTRARGTVTNVQQIQYGNFNYYQVSIDYGYSRDINVRGSIFGTFKPNPKSKVLNTVAIGQTYIDVDSTISFPKFGEMITADIDGNNVAIAYSGKTSNQFFNVTGVTGKIPLTQDIELSPFSYAYTDITQRDQIQVRIASSLKDLQLDEQTNYFRSGDTVLLKSLGLEAEGKKANQWVLNVKTRFGIKEITVSDLTNRVYNISFTNIQFFEVGYKVSLINEDRTITIKGTVNSVTSKNAITVKFDEVVNLSITGYSLENDTLTGDSTKYPQINNFIANVQNTYSKFNGDVLVASNSIPKYNNTITNPYDKKITFSQSVSVGLATDIIQFPTNNTNLPDHGFYTGDSVFYTPGSSGFVGLDTGAYFIKRLNPSDVKLARSKADLFKDTYVSLEGTATDCRVSYNEYAGKIVTPQGLYREILPPDTESGTYHTPAGFTGVLINGVEVLNYKSENSVYYGNIKNINITKGGFDYDIINPPILRIRDEVGVGATGKCNVLGSLKQIQIIDPGLGYKKPPLIRISGGNGVGAQAEAKLIPITYSLAFNAEASFNQVDLTNNQIAFSTFSKLDDGDQLIYQPGNPGVIAGLNTDQRYYAFVVTDSAITLHLNLNDAYAGINTVNLTGYGNGIQYFTCVEKKNIVSQIIVTDPGTGYENKERTLSSIGIQTSLNRVNIINHGYETQEIVRYYEPASGVGVGGLKNNQDYYVHKIDDNSFELSESFTKLEDQIYLNFTSVGGGSFNYPPIEVKIEGQPSYFDKTFVTDFTTLYIIESPIEENIETPTNVLAWTQTEALITNNAGVEGEFYVKVNGTSNWLISDKPFIGNQRNYDAIVQPIFRGSLSSVDLTEGGVGYGASEIIDFNRQPDLLFESGKNARITPIINNGQISDIIINSGGEGYNAIPNLKIISETGNFAILTPQIDKGQLVNIVINSGGKGYVANKTFIEVIAAGSAARANCDIHSWNVNLFTRTFNNILNDDGIISENIKDNSLEYSHLYGARPLRENVDALDGFNEDNIKYGTPDLIKVDKKEVDSQYHSPILGWAYDGNPIYGPYGFENIDGTGSIIKMTSGYVLSPNTTNRPSFNAFESGFFVNDWKYVGNSTLDNHNGRFCVTPDYPEGIYAYFTTIDNVVDSSGPFKNYFQPVFPYFVGNTFKNKPNPFNFKSGSNQVDYDIQSDNWFRNSTFLFTNGGTSQYDYIFNSNTLIQQGYDVTATSTGTVDSIVVENPGTNYQVLDRVSFDTTQSDGSGLDVRVASVTGKPIQTISVATTTFTDVEFKPYNNNTSFVGYTTYPHDLLNKEKIIVNGLTDYFDGFNGAYQVGVSSEALNLTLGISSVASSGIVTYFYVSGRVSRDFVRENDILSIEGEKVKVLNVDPNARRLRVLRNQENTVGASHSSGALILTDPRSFEINVGSIKTTKTFITNREYYFDAVETIGVGTVAGIGETIVFSNPGLGVTQIFLQPQQIFLPDHGLKLNDKLVFSLNDGNGPGAQVWNGQDNSAYFNLTDVGVSSSLYAVPFTQNIIGIASGKQGINTISGIYTGINDTPGLLYFNTSGAGTTQSLTTDLENVITARVDKNVVTVGLGQSHALRENDQFKITINPFNILDVDVRFNEYNRRMVFNPQGFSSVGVDTSANVINMNDHGYVKGEKVLYEADVAISGLANQMMYYIVPYTDEAIQLVENKEDAYAQEPTFIELNTQAPGVLYRINPPIKVQKNQTVRFDLSSPTLSFLNGSQRYAGFSMGIYSDSEYTNNFYTTGTQSEFEVTTNGTVGVSTDAYLQVYVSDQLPSILYYNFENDNLNILPESMAEIVIDDDVIDYTQIDLVPNVYSGQHTVTGVGTLGFEYNVSIASSILSYNTFNASMEYDTTSRFEKGGVSSLRFLNKGGGYKSIPGFSSIVSVEGTGALLVPSSDTIGEILNWKANNIGFDYPTDTTMRGVANLPEILTVTPLLSFDRVGISSGGVNYIFAPDLIVKDGFTDDVITDVELAYELGDTQVTIITNTQSLYDVPPQIIPTQNSNGYDIAGVSYDNSTKVVRLTLDKQFSFGEYFPFIVGQRIIVENINIGVNTTGKGYNSQDYDYELFPIVNVDAQFGGAGAFVEYDLTELLKTNEQAGIVSSFTAATVTPESFFPIFESTLKISDFVVGEEVLNDEKPGTVERWDPIGKLLYVSTEYDFQVGSALTSSTSNIKSIIQSKIEYDAEILTGAGATFIEGWQTDSGKLNNNLQVLPNNEYYQNFSYSLKSRVPYQTWNDPVSTLNHTAGFDLFSDLVVETTAKTRLAPAAIDVEQVVDLKSEYSINCVPDYDRASENTTDVNGTPVSYEIVFENRVIQDYFESRGNRVLSIDDIGYGFDSNPRSTPYMPIGYYGENQTFAKVFTFARDTNLRDRTQFAIVDVLQDRIEGYTNQYARIESKQTLGWYNYAGFGTEGWSLDFYPYDFEYNNYQVSSFSINVDDTLTGIGSTGLGDVVQIAGFRTDIGANATQTIVSFGTTYRSAKILVQYQDANNNFYANELNLLHDDTDVVELQYGDITNNEQLSGLNGFGTYVSEIDGSDVVVKFVSDVGVALTCTGNIVAISTGGNTGINSVSLRSASVSSFSTSISASGTPTENVVASFWNPQASGYFILSIEDTTNDDYELIEVAAIDTEFNRDDGITQWGEIITTAGLGTVGLTTSGTGANIVFTPNPSIDVTVNTFGITLESYDNNLRPENVELGNNSLISTTGEYVGTEYDKNTSFELMHDENRIFMRYFNGSSSTSVNLDGNSINLPNHYFVTGEKVEYVYTDSLTSSDDAIGIAATTIAGVTTDKLPTELYIVKRGESAVSFAASATDALLRVPEILDLTSLGIGTYHKIVATNQDAKALVAIDNMIQAPLTNTLVNTEIEQDIVFDTSFNVTGIQTFRANDLIQIDDEMMLIQSIGVGVTNRFDVLRAQMGSVAVPHSVGSTVALLGGQYTIRDSTIFFSGPPAGNTPIGTTTGGPDDVSWVGVTTRSTFQGRTFMRSGVPEATFNTYQDNYTFDNIQGQFNGVENEFRITSDNGTDIAGFSTNQAIILNSNILQEPQGDQFGTGDFDLHEDTAGITSIRYTGTDIAVGYDPARSDVPRGGIIVSLASTEGFGYQPLISAGATCTVSGLGTIQTVSVGNSGSGYRVGVQTIVNVYTQKPSNGVPIIASIGTAIIQNGNVVSVAVTNGVGGYMQSEPPDIVFDAPLPYSNIPLEYVPSSVGSGLSATVDVFVGAGGSVVDFSINNFGYGYGEGEVLTIGVGGTVGIPTHPGNTNFRDFEVTVDEVFRDTFNGWTIGEIDVFDELDGQFNGEEVTFSLTIDNNVTSIYTPEGSPVELDQNLLVFINDILQNPGAAYKFNGGSEITFTEAPKQGDTSKILFYKGTPGIDVVFVDILETVKVGDTLTLHNDSIIMQGRDLNQLPRVVTGITTLDTVTTNAYRNPGVTTDRTLLRPVTWCKQTDDLVIDGSYVTKDRVSLEPTIYPSAYLIKSFDVGDKNVYVDSCRPLFDQQNETLILDYQFDIELTDQASIVAAAATATLKSDGSIDFITVTNPGVGYTNLANPSVSISYPTTSTSGRATATANVGGDIVQTISVTNAGLGYTAPPTILIEQPSVIRERIGVSTYVGDQGTIVGVAFSANNTTTLELYIPQNSFMRDDFYVGAGITVSQLDVGDSFVVNLSNIGINTLSTINGVYTVTGAYNFTKNFPNLGFTTTVRCIEFDTGSIGPNNFSSTLIHWDNNVLKFDNQDFPTGGTGAFQNERIYGEYTFGKIITKNRPSVGAKNFVAQPYDDLVDSPLIERFNPLRFVGYATD